MPSTSLESSGMSTTTTMTTIEASPTQTSDGDLFLITNYMYGALNFMIQCT